MNAREHSFDTSSPVTARVTFPAGDLSITAEDTAQVSVSIRPDRDEDRAWDYVADCTVELHGTELVVQAPEGGGWLKRTPSLDVEIIVPTDSSLRTTLASADLRTSGRFADADVTSASGDVRLSELTGGLSLKSASGDVTTDDVAGRVKINSASGDVRLRSCGDEVSVNTASGDIQLASVGESFSAKTASGDVTLAAARAGKVSINTASGDVKVGVASGTGVYLDLTSLSGDTTTNLEMEGDQPTGSTELHLTVRTLSGDIRIDRAH